MTAPSAPSPQTEARPGPEAPASPAAIGRSAANVSRKTMWLSAGALFGALLVGIIAIAVFSDPGKPDPTNTEADRPPSAIVAPNSGTAPENPGDRGGSEQLLLMGGMAIAIVGIGVVIFRGGPKARANRERWKAAAATGEDSAVPR